jgi:hypothetical protein
MARGTVAVAVSVGDATRVSVGSGVAVSAGAAGAPQAFIKMEMAINNAIDLKRTSVLQVYKVPPNIIV